ncbi:MAG: YdjY domain-containing protein [Planctomycetota bacterium]
MSTRPQAGAWILVALALAGCVDERAADAPSAPPALSVDRGARRVSLPATLQLAAFAAGDPPGHHLVTWRDGRAGGKALLACAASDTEVLDALESLGAVPGDTLTEAAWTYRDDPERPEPDMHATGAPLEVRVTLPDGRELPIAALLEDLDGKGTEWVLAGNRALIDVWRSGCVVCLQSCPGSKVANRAATIRDLAQGAARFRASALARELGEGAELTVHLQLAE